MRAQARQILDWFDGFRSPVPSWYTEKWKKGEGFLSREQIRSILDEVAGWLLETPPETGLALLRPFREQDREDFLEYVSQPELQRLCGMSYDSEEEKEADFRRRLAEPQHSFAVVWKDSGKVIGNLSLGIYPFVVTDPVYSQKRGVSLSFLLHEAYQKRGVMSGLLRAVLRLCLEQHDLDFVNAGYFSFNQGSRRLLERCGFRFWMTHRFRFRGEDIATQEMLVLREELPQTRPS